MKRPLETEFDGMRAKFLTRLGHLVRLTYRGEVKMKKSYLGLPITKVTQVTCRAGVKYDNIAAVQEKRENGELPSENAGLKGMSWVVFPHILIGDKSQEESWRFATIPKRHNKVTRYFVGDVEVSKNEIPWEHAYASSSKGASDVFNVKAKNIVSL
jgi:hypothetical protein